MNKKKILNDPIYGFVNVPYGIIFDLMEHPYFQRLRRIKQLSLTHYVYPGALHTRFHHALGALHLMTQAIETLRSKGTEITEEEAKAVSIAILLHDIGHGPFSHTLENTLINVTHEELSVLFMEKLNVEFNGALSMTLDIFRDKHPKKFLHQLVSSQLDMDRMDYLNRDSYFTGVHEGVIGYHRLIKMLAVHNDELVIEEKGIYSIEKFLVARRLMYWQVYLHKTVLSAELMLIQVLNRAKHLVRAGWDPMVASPAMRFFLENTLDSSYLESHPDTLLTYFSELDDIDIIASIKTWVHANDPFLAFLSKKIVDRQLFRLDFSNLPFEDSHITNLKEKISNWNPFDEAILPYLLIEGKESNSAYSTSKDEIKILFKNGMVKPMSDSMDYGIQSKNFTKHYLCYPKEILKASKNMILQ
jgi:HD superfamily phosphohydrolase